MYLEECVCVFVGVFVCALERVVYTEFVWSSPSLHVRGVQVHFPPRRVPVLRRPVTGKTRVPAEA